MSKVILWATGEDHFVEDRIFRDSNNYIHVLGFDSIANPANLYYAVSTNGGTTFTDGEGGGSGTKYTVATSKNDSFSYYGLSSIAVDSNSNIYAFWIDQTDGELYFRKKSAIGGTWDTGGGTSISDAVSTGNGSVTEYLRVEIDSSDNIIVTAYDGDILRVFASIDGGDNWTFEDSVDVGTAPARMPDNCLDFNDNIWHVVKQGSDIDVYKITKNTGDTWSIGAKQNLFTGNTVVPTIVAERDSETIWVFQSYYVGGNVVQLRYEKYSEGSWNGSWTIIDSKSGDAWAWSPLSSICTYNNNIYVTTSQAGVNGISWYWYWDGSSWITRTDLGFSTVKSYTLTLEEPENLSSDWNRDLYFVYKDTSNNSVFDKYSFPREYIASETLTLSDSIIANIPQETINISENITLIDATPPEDSIDIEATITLSDTIVVNFPQETIELEDTVTLSDEIELNVSLEKIQLTDTINLNDSIIDWRNIENDFRMMMGVLEDIPSDFRSVIESVNDITNAFRMVEGNIEDVENDIRYATEPLTDVINDFRMLKSWQVPVAGGFQSLGKTYIKVYINGSVDEDVDINSININKVLNSTHTADFVIGRPYDTANKPTIEYPVEIRYYEKDWVNYHLLYKGYITQINPGDDPDTLKINCKDRYWLRNRELKYFYIGHQPSDNQELYYETISEGLTASEFSGLGLGNFIPQTMNLFGRGESDCISALIDNSGNYSWYYDVDDTKKLWTANRGSIVNLERQELNQNIGLYQVLRHSFTESIEDIVNKFRVTMGDKVIRRFNSYGGSKEYDGSYYYLDLDLRLTPGWEETDEVLAKDSDIEDANEIKQGFDNHSTDYNTRFADVYTKYIIPFTSTDLEAYTDRFEPRVSIEAPVGSEAMKTSVGIRRGLAESNILKTTVTGGYTIDYKNRTVTFGERTYLYTEDSKGEVDSTRAPIIRISIWKQKYLSRTNSPSDNPQDAGDITSPLVFLTDKLGDYSETVWGELSLSGLGIQYGGWYISGYDTNDNAIWQYIPTWDDTAFATDYANWKLTESSDKKTSGQIDITVDAMCHYGIKLSNRIMIDGVLDDSLNITSINYNLNNFTVTLSLNNKRYFKRSVSIQPRGV